VLVPGAAALLQFAVGTALCETVYALGATRHMKRLKQLRACLVCTVAFSSQAVAPQPGITAGIREWVLEGTNGFGTVTAIERCGDTLFIADAAQRIRRFNLATERLMDDLGGDRVAFPTALMADCPGRRLFVITAIPMRKDATAAVQVFDSESGELRREYALPRTFLPRPGGRFEPPDSLIVSGLWVPPDRSPASLVSTAAARYYEGLRLGVKLLLDDGEVEPLLVPYETVCIGAGQCPDVRVDSIPRNRPRPARPSSICLRYVQLCAESRHEGQSRSASFLVSRIALRWSS
jgi:hypothetical protein